MNALTGIPIEVLFGLIGALGLLVYGDLRRNQNRQTKAIEHLSAESGKRGRQMSVFRVYLRQLCEKGGIHFDDDDGAD